MARYSAAVVFEAGAIWSAAAAALGRLLGERLVERIDHGGEPVDRARQRRVGGHALPPGVPASPA